MLHFFNQIIANTTLEESSCCWNFTNWLSFSIIVKHIANLLDICTDKICSRATWSPSVQILDRGILIPLSEHQFCSLVFRKPSWSHLTHTNRLTLYNPFYNELSLIGWQTSHLDKLWSGEEWRLTILEQILPRHLVKVHSKPPLSMVLVQFLCNLPVSNNCKFKSIPFFKSPVHLCTMTIYLYS